MCGIAGVAGLNRERGAAAVRAMSDAIRHRGPDDSGEFATDGFAFGMRRLSIIDLDSGHQPIWTPRGTGVVFNGEIYNYRDLREDLVKRGVNLATQSDTEVIAHLYDLHGLNFVGRLEGMFAICLYDPKSAQFHLIRDRLGKKPLYCGEIDGALYFASELKAIVSVASRPQIDPQAIYDFLTLRYVPEPGTIWKGLSKVEPGSILSYDLQTSKRSARRFWSLGFKSEPLQRDRDYEGEFRELFHAAVEKRLVAADVPVGILLSGGLDSSAVAAAAAEMGHANLHSFSVAFEDGGDSDETPFARLVAGRVGMQHHEVVIGQKDFIDALPMFVRSTDEPLADLASIPLYFVSKLARENVKVVLSGEGADEMLAGYDMPRVAGLFYALAPADRMPWFLRRPMGCLMTAIGRPLVGSILSHGHSRALGVAKTHMTRLWSEGEKQTFWRGTKARSTDALIEAWYDGCVSSDPMDQMQQVYARSWLVEDLLMKADKMSMATSLELRCPFLDHRLAEWCTGLPLEWKVGSASSAYESKRILRRYAAPRLPAEIITRPKRGFPVPAYGWLANGLSGWANERLAGGRLANWLDMRALAPDLSSAAKGHLPTQHRVWSLLVLDHWLEAWA